MDSPKSTVFTFDLHLAIIGLEKQFLVFFLVAAKDRFYCSFKKFYHLKQSFVYMHLILSHLDPKQSAQMHMILYGLGLISDLQYAHDLYFAFTMGSKV